MPLVLYTSSHKRSLSKDENNSVLGNMIFSFMNGLQHTLSTNDLGLSIFNVDYLTLVPVRDGLSILSRGPNPTFHFQVSWHKHNMFIIRRFLQLICLLFLPLWHVSSCVVLKESRKITGRLKKSGHSNDILALIRRAKRTVWKREEGDLYHIVRLFQAYLSFFLSG